ncbi:MAG: hypothetical protein ACI8PB_005440, partial [Desulforhopalus sp.]
EKKTLFEKLFSSPDLLRLEKSLFQTSIIMGVRDKSTLESEEPKLESCRMHGMICDYLIGILCLSHTFKQNCKLRLFLMLLKTKLNIAA